MSTLERRGKPHCLRRFANRQEAISVLADALDRQRRDAREKLANRPYWSNTGSVEIEVLNEIEAIIARTSEECSNADAFVVACHEGLATLCDRLRSTAFDADGYGLGTVYAVQRALEGNEVT